MPLVNHVAHNSSVVDEIDAHCIPGYKKLPLNVRTNFEENTHLGRRLVGLIKLRDEFTVPSDWYKHISYAIQACVDILFLYRAKSMFIKSIPHLKRDYAAEYENILAEVKRVGEESQNNPISIDSSQQMLSMLGPIVGTRMPMAYITAITARQSPSTQARHSSSNDIDNVAVFVSCSV